MSPSPRARRRDASEQPERVLIGIGRAFAGALIFSLPILMTMEVWWLGFYMDPLRLVLLLAVTVALLVRLSRYGGFRHTRSVWDDGADAMVALAVAAVASLLVLWMFSVIDWDMSWRELVGKIALQSIPGSIGAMLARSQLGSARARRDRRKAERSYGGELFLMMIGGLFLSLNVAPTEEVMLIAHQMSVWQSIGLVAATLIIMHAMVYFLEFGGTVRTSPDETFWSIFGRFTVAGYAVVLIVSLYLLWSFGRIEAVSFETALGAGIVLAMPGAVGAAVARLIL